MSGDKGDSGAEDIQVGRWPYCATLDGTCLVYETGQYLGKSARSALLTFIFSAEEGARLTLQRNRDGFSVQITGAVQRAERESMDLTEMQELQNLLHLLAKEATET